MEGPFVSTVIQKFVLKQTKLPHNTTPATKSTFPADGWPINVFMLLDKKCTIFPLLSTEDANPDEEHAEGAGAIVVHGEHEDASMETKDDYDGTIQLVIDEAQSDGTEITRARFNGGDGD